MEAEYGTNIEVSKSNSSILFFCKHDCEGEEMKNLSWNHQNS